MYQGLSLGLYEKAMPAALGWDEKFRLAACAGFDYLELSIDETQEKLNRLDWRRREFQELRSASQRAGVPVRSICLSAHRRFPLGSRNAAVRARSLEILKKAVAFAAEAGVRIIQLAGYDVYYEESGEDTREFFEEGLSRCVEFAAEAGVILAFETMETPFMNTVEKAMYYVDKMSSPYLQIYPDVGNVTNGAADALRDLQCGRGHLVAAHLKETRPAVFRDLEFGQGRVDFPACIRILREEGVKMFVCEFWYAQGVSPEEYLKRNVGFIRAAIDRGGRK